MPLILTIDPDKRQTTQLATLVTTELQAELVHRATAAEALADAIPAEAPVPVVEMQTFETLDAIASQFAAAPLPKHESLDGLASLFAATPTLLHTAPIEVPGIDPSLLASPEAQPPRADDTPFSFTFVDGFGDTWSDFDVPSVTAAPAPATTPAPEPAAAPMLDDEALSPIGDAAHRASLDAYVIEDLGPGMRHVERKATNTHAGATHVASAAPAVKKKAPVQDEWGLFDPEQCGFAALKAEDPAERRKPRDGTRVRVISY